MLLGWLGLDSWGATAPSACVPPPASRVDPGFPSSQLCRSHISPSLWEHRAQGCATEERGSTLAGIPKAPRVTLRVSPARGAAARGCLGPWGFGVAAAGPRVTQRH